MSEQIVGFMHRRMLVRLQERGWTEGRIERFPDMEDAGHGDSVPLVLGKYAHPWVVNVLGGEGAREALRRAQEEATAKWSKEQYQWAYEILYDAITAALASQPAATEERGDVEATKLCPECGAPMRLDPLGTSEGQTGTPGASIHVERWYCAERGHRLLTRQMLADPQEPES